MPLHLAISRRNLSMFQLVFDVMEQGDLTPVIIKKVYYLTM
jgi:hypothetical protein